MYLVSGWSLSMVMRLLELKPLRSNMPSFELYDGSAVFHSVKRGVGLSTLILSLFGWLLNTYFVPVSDYPTDFRVSINSTI